MTALFVLSLKNGFGQVYYEYQKLQSPITNDCTSYGLLNYPGDLHSSDTRMIVPMSYFQCDTAVNVVALYEKVDNLWMPDTVIYLLDTTIWLSIRAIISDEFACV
ncbi:MAG: hypothetical protein JNM00_14350, partial [Flavobacteriales bacterium]|nr:hypothetical protein [Flavobacteriales bacterium]